MCVFFMSHNLKDEESLNSKLCTFTQTRREFANQHWYHCHTCKLMDGSGVCSVCAKVCHSGHVVTYSKHGSFFCDCGAKEDGSCSALVKRTGTGDDRSGSPLSPQRSEQALFADNSSGRRNKSKKKNQKNRRPHEEDKHDKADNASKRRETSHPFGRRSSFPSLPILRIIQQIDKYKSQLFEYLNTSGITSHTLELLHQVLSGVVTSVDRATSIGASQARQAMIDLHQCDKKVEYADNLMVRKERVMHECLCSLRIMYLHLKILVLFMCFMYVTAFCVSVCIISYIPSPRLLRWGPKKEPLRMFDST